MITTQRSITFCKLRFRLYVTLITASVLLATASTSSAGSLIGLGDAPGGSFASIASDVSADGSVVVGRTSSGGGVEAFRWTSNGGMVSLGELPGGQFDSRATGVSADGSVAVGQSNSASGREAFRWTSGGGIVGLGDLPGGTFFSGAADVSADGSVVVGTSISASGFEAFRWTGGGLIGLGDLPGGTFSSIAAGISADGSVVVGESNITSGVEAFRWTGGGMVGLGDLPGGSFSSKAADVSADGSVVVGTGSSVSGPVGEAFRWTSGGGMVGLGDLPGGSFFSVANGVSADGSLVVGEGSSISGSEAFLWTAATGMRSVRSVLADLGIDLAGFSNLTAATKVSDDRRTIVGNGTRGINSEAFVVDLHNLDLHWISPGSGVWETRTNWTTELFSPEAGDNVFIDPVSGLTVSGPTVVTTVGSLTLGAQSSGTAILDIQPTGNMTVSGLTTITSRGRLTGDGTFAALGGIDNQGEIDLGTASLQITGGTLNNNNGLIRGNGQIDARLDNAEGGEVRAESGRRILLTGMGNFNSGEIHLLGGTVEFRETLLNTETGFIAGRGTLIVKGTLFNTGTLAFSGGTTDVFGDVINATIPTSSGRIVTTGGATTTFFDDLIHDGAEIRTSAGSSTVILGAASGAGPYTGTGTVFFEGDLRPGNSAAAVEFGGDVILGFSASTNIEIGGLLAGSEYDQLLIAGDLSLDGDLIVSLINGFSLGANNEFEILDIAGTLSGQFAGLGEGALVGNFGGQDLFISYAAGDGNDVILFTAVPEPSSLVLLAMGLLGLSRARHAGRNKSLRSSSI